ncbi:hypothetical protein [Streptomyces acidiscabies]|uniref:hypothetical protein n=1 Tax=Streptomyces acidiscabies TaxID=42234 RepID=UPI0038F74B1D
MPLQCTAFTEVPQGVGAHALREIPEIEEDWWEVIPAHALCELGEHDDHTEHASVLWYSLDLDRPRLWMARWTGAGRFSICRFELGAQCFARKPGVEECTFFAGHPSGHSWEVKDPVMVALEALPPALRMRLLGPKDES